MSALRRLGLILPLLAIAGCQRYAPAPLDFDAHRRGMEARDPASAFVELYARRLAEQRGTPTALDIGDGLSMEEGRVVALYFNPRLRSARLRAQVPLAGAAEAGRWEDPELRVDLERIIESVEHPWVIGGVLGLTIPLSGRLKMEKNLALAEADVEQLRALAEEQKLLAGLRESWLEWSSTVEQIALTKASLAALEEVVRTAEKLRAAGELDPLDARLFRIERLMQMGALQSLESEARAGEIEVKSLLGLVPDAPVKLAPTLTVDSAPNPTTRPTTDWIERHPQLRVARADYLVAERELELQIRKQYPDLAVGGGFGEDEGDQRMLGEFALPLPIWNANRRAIAEARAKREAARADAEGEYERLLSESARARAALESAGARLRFVDTELAPLVDEQLAAARQLTRLGDHNTLVLLEALKAAHEAKVQVVEARLKLALAVSRMNALVPHEDARP